MKNFTILLSFIFCVFLLVSCGNNPPEVPQDTDADTEHIHEYTSTVIPPSCTDDGYTLHTCKSCDDKYSDSIVKALEHNYSNNIKDTYCNQFQEQVFTCSVCEHSYSHVLNTKGTIHNYRAEITYPDRENKGYTTHKCENCNDTYVDSYTDPVNFSVGLSYTKVTGGYFVSGIGTCTDIDLIIPSISEQGYKVIGIAAFSFENTKVRSVTVPEGISKIEQSAFASCTTLESVTLPEKINIDEDIFGNNPILRSLTMPLKYPIAYYFNDYRSNTPTEYKSIKQGGGSISSTYYGSIPYSLKEINILSSPLQYALYDCEMITTVNISQNATQIGACAFMNCTGLNQISIPDSIKSIGASAFAYTSITKITIPDSVKFTNDDRYIFSYCSQLTEVILPKNTTIIPDYMFLYCTELKKIELPDSVTYLGASFAAATSIKNISIPSGVTVIYSYAFNSCTMLEEITLPKKLVQIDNGAFENCTSLKTIDLPKTLTKIGNSVFSGCTSLEEIIIPSSVTTLDHSIFKDCTSLRCIELPNSITSIPHGMFFGCSSLREITIPDSVTKISASVFEKSGILCITLSESISSVGMRAFADCAYLKEITFLGDNVSFTNEVFMGATALESLCIPKNVTTIPYRFCSGATSLKTVILNEGLQVIMEDGFYGCTALEELTLPSTLRGIQARTFKGCTSLKSVDLSSTNIGEEACKTGVEWFADCSSLVEVKGYEKLKYINSSLFRNTPIQFVEDGMTIAFGWLLEASPDKVFGIVTIPQGVTKIYDYAFSKCNNIEELIISEGVTFLGTRILGESGNTSTHKLTLPDSLSTIDTGTVYFLPNIQELVVGKGLEKINGNSFGSLTILRFRGTVEEFRQMPWCDHIAIQNLTIICTDGTVERN